MAHGDAWLGQARTTGTVVGVVGSRHRDVSRSRLRGVSLPCAQVGAAVTGALNRGQSEAGSPRPRKLQRESAHRRPVTASPRLNRSVT